MILEASISFRAVPKAINTIFSEFVCLKDLPTPSHKSVSRWLCRVGLYKLNSPKEQADDWALIIDNSIQVGTQKCLVILGVRLSSLKWTPLKLNDVHVLFIAIHEKSDNNFVVSALEKAQEKVGRVKMVCADNGPDLSSGITLFCKKYNVGRCYDAIHKIGCFLKKILGENPKWEAFTKEAAKAKKKMQQTKAAHLMPPNQRTKSRFLNTDILTQWGVDALSVLTGEECRDKELLKEYCGWLLDYKEFIEYLGQVDSINKKVREHIRDYGLSSNTGYHIENLLDGVMKSIHSNWADGCQYASELIEFFHEHSKIVPLNEIWIGSSEIIETLFGKFKVLEKNHSKEGFTSLVLGMAACTGSLNTAIINSALEETKTKDVDDWVKTQIGQTFLSKRRERLSKWRRKSKTKRVKKAIRLSKKKGQELTGVVSPKAACF